MRLLAKRVPACAYRRLTREQMAKYSRPKPRSCTPAFNGLMDFLEDWRTADHADTITLSRNQIVELIEGVETLRERISPR
jgi:hypothetical protein